MLNRILGGDVRDKHGKYGNEGKYGIRKYRRKGYRDIKGSTLEEEPVAGVLNNMILEGGVLDKTETTGK